MSLLLNLNQRGFVHIDGTLANSLLLDCYIKDRGARGATYNVVSLEISKAFDIVPHSSIREVLAHKGVDPLLIDYIKGTLNSFTSVKVGSAETGPIPIERGVRQGDPLSSTIFNLIIDDQLERLNNGFRGGLLEGKIKCASLAFADDIILLSDSKDEMKELLMEVDLFFKRLGMKINPRKSSALLYGLQNPKISSSFRCRQENQIFTKKTLHLYVHTSDALFHAKLKDGGLGILEMREAIPRIFLGRLRALEARDEDEVLRIVMSGKTIQSLTGKLSSLAGEIPGQQVRREEIKSMAYSKGLEHASQDASSRSWIQERPKGWTGRDYVRAVQLRTANLPTKAGPSNPSEERMCRGGCKVHETICHVVQSCPVTHGLRIERHNEIVKKIRKHCRTKNWAVEDEPHVRHSNGKLFKPDLVIHKPDETSLVVDVQVSWETSGPIETIWARKAAIFKFLALIIGARGSWPRANPQTELLLEIGKGLKRSCVHSALKWGSSLHAAFSKNVWKGKANRHAAPIAVNKDQ